MHKHGGNSFPHFEWDNKKYVDDSIKDVVCSKLNNNETKRNKIKDTEKEILVY